MPNCSPHFTLSPRASNKQSGGRARRDLQALDSQLSALNCQAFCSLRQADSSWWPSRTCPFIAESTISLRSGGIDVHVGAAKENAHQRFGFSSAACRAIVPYRQRRDDDSRLKRNGATWISKKITMNAATGLTAQSTPKPDHPKPIEADDCDTGEYNKWNSVTKHVWSTALAAGPRNQSPPKGGTPNSTSQQTGRNSHCVGPVIF